MAQAAKTTEPAPIDMTKPPTTTLMANKAWRIESTRFNQRGFASQQYHLILDDATVDFAFMDEPFFWRSVASRLRLMDEIVVLNDSLTFRREYIVVQSNPSADYVMVRLVSHVDLASAELPPDSIEGFDVVYRGAFSKWCIVRKTDGHLMRSGIATQSDARNIRATELVPSHLAAHQSLAR